MPKLNSKYTEKRGIPIRILIIGASGFVGRALVSELQDEFDMRLTTRNDTSSRRGMVHLDLSDPKNLAEIFDGIDTVIHTAALVHQMNPAQRPSRADYFHINASATIRLAEVASEMGVKHFIFISSVKVNGEGGGTHTPYKHSDPVEPKGDYAESKAEAERLLMELAERSDLTISIIRPPLVYGPGAKANFATLMKLSRFLPAFPTDSNSGRRSLVSIWNLCDLIKTLIHFGPKKSAVYLVSDDSDCCTYELLQFMAIGHKRNIVGLPIPLSFLRVALSLIGKHSTYLKVFGGLQVDIEHTKSTLNWRPLHDTKEGISRLVALA